MDKPASLVSKISLEGGRISTRGLENKAKTRNCACKNLFKEANIIYLLKNLLMITMDCRCEQQQLLHFAFRSWKFMTGPAMWGILWKPCRRKNWRKSLKIFAPSQIRYPKMQWRDVKRRTKLQCKSFAQNKFSLGQHRQFIVCKQGVV